MKTEDCRRRATEKTLLEHRRRSLTVLFGRLKNEFDRGLQSLRIFLKGCGQSEQGGGMRIVGTGVHDSGIV